MSPSKILFLLCISFIVGIAVESFAQIPHAWLWGFLLLAGGLVVGSLWRNRNIGLVSGFILIFFALGILRIQVTEFNISNDPLKQYRDQAGQLAFTGTIVGEPDIREASQKLKVRAHGTESVVLVTAPRHATYAYLDTLQITGKLKTPAEFDDFSYKNYLMKDGIYSVMDYSAIEITGKAKATTLGEKAYHHILAFKGRLRESINSYFMPPHSSIVEGIMLGNTSTMSKEVKSKMSATGLTHLTAISGSNVLILSAILIPFLLFLGFWRGQAFYISMGFIWLYIAVAGFPASGVRAAIMASVFLLAQRLGRKNATSRVIVLTAAVMLLHNPLLLIYDVGFQLSFLAAMGIIHLKPFIDMVFKFEKMPEMPFAKKEHIKYALDIFAITIAAQIFTFPVISYYFKTISLVGPITNLLIIPVVDWIMVFGFLTAFVGIFSSMLGVIISVPASLLIGYFVKIMEIFYQPWVATAVQTISWVWIAAYYAALAGLIYYLKRFLKPAFLGF